MEYAYPCLVYRHIATSFKKHLGEIRDCRIEGQWKQSKCIPAYSHIAEISFCPLLQRDYKFKVGLFSREAVTPFHGSHD
jgi:hypothetical protein